MVRTWLACAVMVRLHIDHNPPEYRNTNRFPSKLDKHEETKEKIKISGENYIEAPEVYPVKYFYSYYLKNAIHSPDI
ncbi:conserved hypothetical protein [Ricinus communis]|uniref:Uncharacterized protein n=1 Tax=Ricinus communis TaxID=3988 RepID=B9S1U4_RICCO|nr:conserved hypothetical protein [Ricinus communis]